MSIFTAVETGFTKAYNFVITVFTKIDQVDKTFQALAPQTKAAILATFYDASKTFAAGVGAAEAAATGNVATAITLSETTVMLVKSVIADAKNDASIVAADLKALGITA